MLLYRINISCLSSRYEYFNVWDSDRLLYPVGDDRGASSIPRPSDQGDTYRSYVSSTATSDLDDDRHNSILDGNFYLI